MKMPKGGTIKPLQAPRAQLVRTPLDKSLESREHAEIKARLLYVTRFIQLRRSGDKWVIQGHYYARRHKKSLAGSCIPL